MLNIRYDPTRSKEEGQYFIELSIFDPVDPTHIDKLGYWCDLNYLRVHIFRPVTYQMMQIIEEM